MRVDLSEMDALADVCQGRIAVLLKQASAELRLLRQLERAVRADKIGCISEVNVYDSKGHWREKQYMDTRRALDLLEAMNDT